MYLCTDTYFPLCIEEFFLSMSLWIYQKKYTTLLAEFRWYVGRLSFPTLPRDTWLAEAPQRHSGHLQLQKGPSLCSNLRSEHSELNFTMQGRKPPQHGQWNFWPSKMLRFCACKLPRYRIPRSFGHHPSLDDRRATSARLANPRWNSSIW